MLDRRAILAGVALLATRPASGAEPPPLAHGVLAENSLAKEFEPVTGTLPDVLLWGTKGKHRFDDLKGRTILMPLWAEWCGPCLTELPDFARLQTKYGNDKFAIIPVLTGTHRKFTPESLGVVLKLAHADIFEPLIEDRLGNTLATKMAHIFGDEAALPCNLLIAPDGHVVAREMGRISSTDDTNPANSYNDMLVRTQNGAVQSIWGQPAGEEFAKAMADGFLG